MTEREISQLIDERDNAEEAISQAYYIVTGRSPEWSNKFGYPEALEDIDDVVAALKTAIDPKFCTPATETPKEVMPDGFRPSADNAPPQPAPEPAGAIERDILETVDLFLNGDGSGIGGRDLIRKLAAELTRLRSASPVTEEMVERAAKAISEIPASGGLAMELHPSTLRQKLSREMINLIARAALAAALASGGK